MKFSHLFGLLVVEAIMAGLSSAQQAVETPHLLAPPTVGTINPPETPRPIPDFDVESSVRHSLPSHSLTIVRGEPKLAEETPAETLQQRSVGEPEEASPAPPEVETRILAIGVSVYSHRVSRIQWFQAGMMREALVGWDLNALTGVGEFSYQGVNYDLLMAISNEDSANSPELQQVAPDAINFLGYPTNSDSPAGLLTALWQAEKPQLTAAQAERERIAAENARLKAEAPPQPANSTIWFRPKKGSRYLSQTQPEPGTEGGGQ